MSARDLIILGCSSQQPTRFRNHGAYLLRWNDEGFLFDPGEGTQRQFIFAEVAPPTVNRIFISHFHGDHCLGLGSMLMRLNLDKVTHPIHCYYPASGKVYFDRLRFGTVYQDQLQVIEHPVYEDGLVHEDDRFIIEAYSLDHRTDNYGWRIQERPQVKFIPEKIKEYNLKGPIVKELELKGEVEWEGKKVLLSDVSYTRNGQIFSYVVDTLPCKGALLAAKDADLLLCESTYLDEHKELAHKHRHLTARQAALIAKEAGAKRLILTHFSARYMDERVFAEEAKTVFPNTEAAADLKYFPFPKTN